jgi:uncharacterized membrane protein
MMNAYLLALGIGFVTGLRSMTAPALVAWASHYGWLNLSGTPLHFMASPVAVAIWSLLAILEFVADVLPMTPARTAPPSLAVRAITGGLSGSCLAVGGGGNLWPGVVLGIVGAMIGAFAGYHARRELVNRMKVKDFCVALPEDLVAIGLAYFIVR